MTRHFHRFWAEAIALARHHVHERARVSPLEEARHVSLLTTHTLAGCLALLVFGGYFVLVDAGGPVAWFALALFASPLLIAAFVARTGRLAAAHILSSVQLALLVLLVAGLTGGASSFATPWLILVPLEAALSTDRRGIVFSTLFAVAVLAGLISADALELLPEPRGLAAGTSAIDLLSPMLAIFYGSALALSVYAIHIRSQEALETSEARCRMLAANATDLIATIDATGKVGSISQQALRLAGHRSEHLLGYGLLELLDPAARTATLCDIATVLADRSPHVIELEIRAADGATAWIEMNCRRLDEPQLTGLSAPALVAVLRDATDRKRRELELAAAREAADRANRAKTLFLANVSHELRTPLNAIIGFAELLHRELLIKSREQKHAEYCRIMHESGGHLLSLVNDLLDVSRIEAGEMQLIREPFDAARLLTATLNFLAPAAEAKNIRLIASAEPGLPDLHADKRAIRQILLNLVGNALKFTDTGTISVTLACTQGQMEMRICDSGPGVAPGDLAQLGTPFFQAATGSGGYARQREGAGLGLSIVKGLVALHGGSIAFSSAPDAGLTITVRLPLEPPAEPAIAAIAGERRATEPPTRRPRPQRTAVTAPPPSDVRRQLPVPQSAAARFMAG